MKRKRDIKKKNEETYTNIEKKREREREKTNSIVVVVVIVIVTIAMPFLTCLSIHIQVIIRGGMHISETVILSNVDINRRAITDVFFDVSSRISL